MIDYSEKVVRLESEAALATYHPHEDWIRDIATQYVWSSQTVWDLIGLFDDCERVVTLQYIRSELKALRIDPETVSKKSRRDVIHFGEYTREDVPAFVHEHRDRFDWIIPDYRRPPCPSSDDIWAASGRSVDLVGSRVCSINMGSAPAIIG